MRLWQCFSGFQTGVDQAAVFTAKEFGLRTGGCMPKGFITLEGDRPEFAQLYGAVEHKSRGYPPRTFDNVKNTDATVRIAQNFLTAGEKCTLRAIEQYNKPFF